MKKAWEGFYYAINEKGDRAKFKFILNVDIDSELNFEGVAWEEGFSAKTGDSMIVRGQINDQQISFTLTYPYLYDQDENFSIIIDKSEEGHSVEYFGKWNEQNQCWKGEWEIQLGVIEQTDHFEKVEFISDEFEMQ